MRKFTCPCEQVFNVDFPEVVNLDSTPEILKSIKDGSFLTCICPSCNAVLHTDVKTKLEWPTKNITFILIPEIERSEFLSEIQNLPAETGIQTLIGFAELSDRIEVINANLNPLVIESIKYHLAVKALETTTDSKLKILFEKVLENKDMEFHIHGIKKNEVAITIIPEHIYKTVQESINDNPDSEPYISLRKATYISFQNIFN